MVVVRFVQLRKDKVSDVLDQIEWAAAVEGGSKQVFCSFWAGPYTTPSYQHTGWPAYANGVQPCGTNCTRYARPLRLASVAESRKRSRRKRLVWRQGAAV